MDKNVKVIKSKELSSQYEPRFIVVDTDTGEILDDANGYGYKTTQKAFAGYAYKSRSKQDVANIKRKESVIFKWLAEHKEIRNELDAAAVYALKDGVDMTAKDVKAILDDHDIKDLPFSATELLRCWRRGKPQYKEKNRKPGKSGKKLTTTKITATAITKEEAKEIAMSMLGTATYEPPFITLRPVETLREGRESVLRAVAAALSQEIGVDAEKMYGNLSFSNGHNAIVLNDDGSLWTKEQVTDMAKRYATN